MRFGEGKKSILRHASTAFPCTNRFALVQDHSAQHDVFRPALMLPSSA